MSVVIGIDPDMRKSGVCMLDSMGQIMLLESMNINEIIKLIEWNKTALYAIEDVNKISGMYSRNKRQNNAIGLKIAQSVGMCKASATIIEDIISHMTGVRPILAPTGLGKQLKNDAVLFKEVTGYKKPTNEDKRDAWTIANWVFKNKERLTS